MAHDTRRRILSSLLTLASERGLDVVSLSGIADAAGITKATLFSHFGSRKEMTDALYAWIDTMGASEEISLEGSAEDVLQRAADHWIGQFTGEETRKAWRIVRGGRFTDERARTRARSWTVMLEGQAFAVLQALSDTGRLRVPDLDLSATLLSSAILRFIDEENGGEEGDDWLIRRTISRFCRAYAERNG